jgi:hypothetical protein
LTCGDPPGLWPDLLGLHHALDALFLGAIGQQDHFLLTGHVDLSDALVGILDPLEPVHQVDFTVELAELLLLKGDLLCPRVPAAKKEATEKVDAFLAAHKKKA